MHTSSCTEDLEQAFSGLITLRFSILSLISPWPRLRNFLSRLLWPSSSVVPLVALAGRRIGHDDVHSPVDDVEQNESQWKHAA